MKKRDERRRPGLDPLEDRLAPGSLLDGLASWVLGLAVAVEQSPSDVAASTDFDEDNGPSQASRSPDPAGMMPLVRVVSEESPVAKARVKNPGATVGTPATAGPQVEDDGAESVGPDAAAPAPIASIPGDDAAITFSSPPANVAGPAGAGGSPGPRASGGVTLGAPTAPVPSGLSPAALAFLASDGYLPGRSDIDLASLNHVTDVGYGLREGDPQFLAQFASPDTDPGAPGPLAVTREEYNFGSTALVLPGFPGPVELQASVAHPTDLSGGDRPLVVLLHGRHATAYNPVTNQAFFQWPPSAGRLPIPSYQGYDYFADVLASNGYFVVSISANGINARDNDVDAMGGLVVPDLGMLARAQLIQAHLDILNGFDTGSGGTPFGAPFGSRFVGKIDMQNIGTMGHSRGGEGVVRHYLLNQSLGSPYGIKAVLPLAPVDFGRPVINDVPLGVVLPYADGDVSDLQGMHYFDDARYNDPGDLAAKYAWVVSGANHNFFNTVWTPGLFPAGTADDWDDFVPLGFLDPDLGSEVPGNDRLTVQQQQGVGRAYMGAFFRAYLGGESQFLPILKGEQAEPPSALGAKVHETYHAPDTPSTRLDLNRTLTAANLAVNTLGGAVTTAALATYGLFGGAFQALPTQSSGRQPHTTPSAFSTRPGLSQVGLAYDGPTAAYQNDLPAGSRDVSRFDDFQFRAGLAFNDVFRNQFTSQDFRVILTDGSGRSVATSVGQWSDALYHPPGKYVNGPKLILNMVRIPLLAFAGIDLTDLRSVQFKFDLRPSGSLFLTDLAFSDPASPTPA